MNINNTLECQITPQASVVPTVPGGNHAQIVGVTIFYDRFDSRAISMKELIEWLESQSKQMDYEISIEVDEKLKTTKQGVLMGYNTVLAHLRMHPELEINNTGIGFFG